MSAKKIDWQITRPSRGVFIFVEHSILLCEQICGRSSVCCHLRAPDFIFKTISMEKLYTYHIPIWLLFMRKGITFFWLLFTRKRKCKILGVLAVNFHFLKFFYKHFFNEISTHFLRKRLFEILYSMSILRNLKYFSSTSELNSV